MSKHNNKYWIREKLYFILCRQYDISRRTRANTFLSNREIDSGSNIKLLDRLRTKFYNEYRGFYKSSPKDCRNVLNRRQRYKSKNSLFKEIRGFDVIYEDNYKDASWYW